jgi:hypothetical protein
MKRGKKGIMQLPFSMIFSIILIIAFVSVAFYVMGIFLGWWSCANTGLFAKDLQDDINLAFNQDETSETFVGKLPGKLDYVCFVNSEEEGRGDFSEYYDEFERYGVLDSNMFFVPIKKTCKAQKFFEIKHVDIKKITEKNNPMCFKNIGGRVEIKIEKGFYDSLVNLG